MDASGLWILFGCTTFVAAALCVVFASRARRHALLLGIAPALAVDAFYLFGAFRFAGAGASGHYDLVGPLLIVATFVPAWVWLIGWRQRSSLWVRIAAAAVAALLWVGMAAYFGLWVGCTLDIRCG